MLKTDNWLGILDSFLARSVRMMGGHYERTSLRSGKGFGCDG